MGYKRKNQYSPYHKRIVELLKEDSNRERSFTSIAKQVAKEFNIKYKDSLRTYISRVYGNRKDGFVKNTAKSQISLEESSENATWKYEGEESITTLEQALKFANVDPNLWEVERWKFNSWDVTSRAGKRTNYQVTVWFARKVNLEIESPKFRNITVKSTKHTQMWIVIGCIHRPFHDKVLWDKFLHFLEVNKKDITGIVINGDYLDLRSLSSHEEWIPEGVDLSYEYSDGLQGIDEIEERLKKSVDKIFHYGNHEDRFFRDKSSIRKYGRSLPSPHEAMQLEERGWQINTDWKNGYTTLGKNLDIFHGTKVGVNAAKDQLLALPNRSHIFNHTHRFGIFSNQLNSAYNTGCMIDFESDMFKYVDRGVREAWSHGFAVAYIDANGNNHVYPIKVDNDKEFFFKGVIY